MKGAGQEAARQKQQQQQQRKDGAAGPLPVNIAQQALEAREAGIADVCRLLASPEDLGRLEQLRAEVGSKLASSRSLLSSSAAAQVDAARHGLQLLDKCHRHIAKLRGCIDRVDALCAECTNLVEHHEQIRALSHAHRNVSQVLEELGDVIDLPSRASAVEELLAQEGGLVAAFEGLTVLQGTSNNIREAWKRSAKRPGDLGDLAQYLNQVNGAMASFERRLWSLARDYHRLGRQQPRLLVDVARVVEMQEQMDAHYSATKASYVRPKHFRERLLLEVEAAVGCRFAPLLALAQQHGQPNSQASYDQDGNTVLSVSRDYLGALTQVERADPQGRMLPGATDAELASMTILEEAVFSEELWLETLLGGFTALEVELAEAHDFVSPCFPPHYAMFDAIFQLYHVQFAQAMDLVGGVSPQLSTAGQLQLMQWVSGYQQTLRGLGVQEELVRLPVAPLSSNPDGTPGFGLLLDSYTDRMEATMTAWYKAILQQDLAGQPQQMSDGTLRSIGSVDFFRMLNEQVSVLEEVSRGEVLLAAAQRCLKLMRGFVGAQQAIMELRCGARAGSSGPGPAGSSSSSSSKPVKDAPAGAAGGSEAPLSFEMVCALLNNAVDCHQQSLEFSEHVQSLLDEACRGQLQPGPTCAGFLQLAAAWGTRLVEMVHGDAGMAQQWRRMYTTTEWLGGTTTATILATIGDYFNDITTFVELHAAQRVMLGVLEELVRRASSGAVAACERGGLAGAATALGGASADAMLDRLAADEAAVQAFFEPYVPPEALGPPVSCLIGVRELLGARDPDTLISGYEAVLCGNTSISPAAVEKLLANRPGLGKVAAAEVALQCRELHAKALRAAGPEAMAAAAAAAAAAAEQPGEAGKGWKFWRERA